MYKFLFLVWCCTALVFVAKAQKPDTVVSKTKADSLNAKRDSINSTKKYVPPITKGKVYHPDSTHSPHKALIRSAIIPGWGQLYNHRWWKVPFIYAGIGLLGDAIVYNQHYYSIFLKEAQLREKGIQEGRLPEYTQVSDADIINAQDGYRRNRDLCILATLGAWGIQMIDAYIDAKFIQRFTMDNDLSFKIKPGFINQPSYAFNGLGNYYPAVTVTFTLR
jgi:hypothetical protein